MISTQIQAISRYLIASFLFTTLIPQSGLAQEKLPLATFSFPSIANMFADVIIGKGFDKANGFAAEAVPYGTPGAFWAGIAKGEIPTHYQSPYQMQKMVSDGVPLAIYGTLVQMSSLQVVARDPDIKTFGDLKGRSLAASVGFAEYEYISMYGRKTGLEFNKDITIVNATTATGRAQLEAGRVDAMISWEPTTTMILKDLAGSRVILDGNSAWKEVAGTIGWQQLLFVRTDYLRDHPGSISRFLKMYRDAATFMTNSPDDADALITSEKLTSHAIPKGVVSTALREKRLVLDVRPSWETETNRQIWTMLEIGKRDGVIPALPPPDSVLSTDPGK